VSTLDAVPEGHWIEVTTNGETFRLVRVPGGWYLPGDVVIASGDIPPVSVEVLGEDPYDERDGDSHA